MDASPKLPVVPLGGSSLQVSRLALGSWRTFERIGRDRGIALLKAAADLGITFFDTARYNDETGSAPIATGYSEVLFGELFREAGLSRAEVVISNKLWWEFWPKQAADEEIDASLERLGFEYVDLVYADALPETVRVHQAVESVALLLAGGKARAWGVVNWPADQLLEASRLASASGVPQPCAVQLVYNLGRRGIVEAGPMQAALRSSGASVVASSVLASGVLSNKYIDGGSEGREAAALDDARNAQFRSMSGELARAATDLGVTPAALAIAFALRFEPVATALVGATKPEQLADNTAGVDLADRLSDTDLLRLRALPQLDD